MSKWDWVKYYDADLINTIVAKVETKIESITLYSNDTFVIWLSRYDLDQDAIQTILMTRYGYEICYGRGNH
jgi:hypothetical protein